MKKTTGILAVALLLFGGIAQAHSDDPTGAGQLPALPQPVDPDTVQVAIGLPESFPAIDQIHLLPDTLLVGRPARLELEFEPDSDLTVSVPDSIGISMPWFHQDGLAVLPADRPGVLQIPVRVFQINPFRVSVGEVASRVMLVDLATAGVQETATIRDPRRWGWNLWTIIIGSVLITGIVLLAWWLWTARKVATEALPDWPVHQPAWISAAIDLDELLSSGLLDRGEARPFLDQLAALTRRYLAGRFHIGAVEMTPPEIRRSCRDLAHPVNSTDPFLDVIEGLDHSRYDPDPADFDFCRHVAWKLHAAMDTVRIVPRFSPVDVQILREGETAWMRNGENLEKFKGLHAAAFAPEGEPS